MSDGVPRIAQRVKELRGRSGLTQQAVAMAAGLSVSVVSQIEQGTNADPRLSTLLALAAALGVSLDELAGPGPQDARHLVAPVAEDERPAGEVTSTPLGEKRPARGKRKGRAGQ